MVQKLHVAFLKICMWGHRADALVFCYKDHRVSGIISCVFFDKMIIDNQKELKKVLVGFSKDSFQIEGIQMILQGDEILKDS